MRRENQNDQLPSIFQYVGHSMYVLSLEDRFQTLWEHENSQEAVYGKLSW